jgi:hypothetical protein
VWPSSRSRFLSAGLGGLLPGCLPLPLLLHATSLLPSVTCRLSLPGILFSVSFGSGRLGAFLDRSSYTFMPFLLPACLCFLPYTLVGQHGFAVGTLILRIFYPKYVYFLSSSVLNFSLILPIADLQVLRI